MRTVLRDDFGVEAAVGSFGSCGNYIRLSFAVWLILPSDEVGVCWVWFLSLGKECESFLALFVQSIGTTPGTTLRDWAKQFSKSCNRKKSEVLCNDAGGLRPSAPYTTRFTKQAITARKHTRASGSLTFT